MTHKTTRFGLRMAAISTLLLLAPAASAEPPRRGDGPPGERLHERMIELRGRLLRKRVGLGEKLVARVEAQLQKGDVERKAVHKAVKQGRRALRQLVEDDSSDEAAFEAALSGLLQARQRMHELRHEELGKLRRLLSAKQMGKLVLALGHLRHKMDRMRPGHRRGGEFRDGPPGERGERRGQRGRRGRRSGGDR